MIKIGIGIGIWLFLGLINIWREWQSIKKWWHSIHRHGGLKYRNQVFKGLLIASPILILGGLVSLIMMEYGEVTGEHRCWWFSTKHKTNR